MVAGENTDGEARFLGLSQLFDQRLMPIGFPVTDKIAREQKKIRPLLLCIPQQRVDQLRTVVRGRALTAPAVRIEVNVRSDGDAQPRLLGEGRGRRSGGEGRASGSLSAGSEKEHNVKSEDIIFILINKYSICFIQKDDSKIIAVDAKYKNEIINAVNENIKIVDNSDLY